MATVKPQAPVAPRIVFPPWLTGRWGMIGVALILYNIVFLAWTYFHWGGKEYISLIGNLAILPPQ